MIITLFERVRTALDLAADAGLAGRVEVWDIQQFLSTNINERSLFDPAARNAQISDIIDAYNQIIEAAETDPSLRIEFEARWPPSTSTRQRHPVSLAAPDLAEQADLAWLDETRTDPGKW